MDLVVAVCCKRFVAKDRRQEHFFDPLGHLAVAFFFCVKFQVASLYTADLSSSGYTDGADDHGLLQ